MGNIISFDENVTFDDDSLVMSNGLTDVLIDYLLLSGSELAETDSEKRFVVFLAEKEQDIVGRGTVGFDIVEMPWQKETFARDKAFLLRMTDHAEELTRQESLWDMLHYEPNREHIEYALGGFRALISRMTAEDVNEDNLNEWLSGAKPNDPVLCGFPKCEKHGVLLSYVGCRFCIHQI